MSGKSCPKCGAEVAFSTVLFAGTPNTIRCRDCKAIMSYGVGVGFLLVPLTICAASLGAAYLAWRASLSPAPAFLGTLFATAFVASFVLAVYFRRNKSLRLATASLKSNQQDESVEGHSQGSARPLIVRLIVGILGMVGALYLGLEVAMGINLFTGEWPADNLLKTVMMESVFPSIGIFFVVETFCYRFKSQTIKPSGWQHASVYLYMSVIVLMSLTGLISLIGVLEEGSWKNILGPLAFLLAPYQAFALLPLMRHKVMSQADSA